jgi:hypothetical protein
MSPKAKSEVDFKSDYEWHVHCAEHGASDYQLRLAFMILTTRTDEKRIVEAYKWMFISTFIGNKRAEQIVTLLQECMSDEQVVEANALVDLWAESKQDEFLEGKSHTWTQELKNSWTSEESRLKLLH